MKNHGLDKGELRMIAICAIAVAAIGAAGWFSGLHSLPAEPPPPQEIPQLNGYDTLLAACWLYVRPLARNDIDETVDYSSNLVFANGHVVNKKYSPVARQTWLKRNAGALRYLRRALGQPFKGPAYTMPLAPLSPIYTRSRELARLLLVESHASELRGDWRAAADSGFDCIALGTKLPSGSGLIAELEGNAIDSIGMRAIWEALPHLSEADVKSDMLRLQAIEAKRIPLRAILERMKADAHGEIVAKLHAHPSSLKNLEGLAQTETFADLMHWKLANYRLIISDRDAYCDKIIAAADRPYRERLLVPVTAASLADPVSADFSMPVSSFFGPAHDDTSIDLLLLDLALRVFKAEHGAYPATLAALVPSTLKNIPRDPFDNDPLRYRLSGAGYLLYSVGPDGTDDGGKAIVHPDKQGPARIFVESDNKGDIVAGINK